MPQPLRAVHHTSPKASGYLVPLTRSFDQQTPFERAASEVQTLRVRLLTESDLDTRQQYVNRIKALGYSRGEA